MAISFYKKGAKLGPVLAFLVATPATSATALLVCYKILGPVFTIFLFFSVILMGVIMGIIGNLFKPSESHETVETCPHCAHTISCCPYENIIVEKLKGTLRFAFWDMPKEIGPELLLGLVLAAVVSVVAPIGEVIHTYLSGNWGYVFGLGFGLIMYICSTGSVPLVDALITQGINIGASMVLLLVGPITSYGTVLVLRKEFGVRILFLYLIVISTVSVLLGYGFSLIPGVGT